MPTYIVLAKWTQEGAEKLKQSPARLDAGKKLYEAAGVKMTAFYMVMGQYDMITVAEAPDDAAMARANLAALAKGALETQTLRAFTEEEYRKLLAELA
jgi:uncharacterized protein with GYD domain